MFRLSSIRPLLSIFLVGVLMVLGAVSVAYASHYWEKTPPCCYGLTLTAQASVQDDGSLAWSGAASSHSADDIDYIAVENTGELLCDFASSTQWNESDDDWFSQWAVASGSGLYYPSGFCDLQVGYSLGDHDFVHEDVIDEHPSTEHGISL